MKKLFLIVIVFILALNSKAQDTTLTERVEYLYDDYYDEYFNGSVIAAEVKAYRLLRAVSLHNQMLWAIGESNSTVAAAALSDLNTLFSTSYSLPTLNFDQTTQSYLDIDSIRLGGMTLYVDTIMAPYEISNLVSDSLSGLSALWRVDISDTADVILAQLREDIADSILVASFTADSTWTSIRVDSIDFGVDINIRASGAQELTFETDAGTGYVVVGIGDISSYTDGGVFIDFTSAASGTVPTLIPNRSYLTTGIGGASNKVILVTQSTQNMVAAISGGRPTISIIDSLNVGGPARIVEGLHLVPVDTIIPANGSIYADSDENPLVLRFWNGTEYDTLNGGGGAGGGVVDTLGTPVANQVTYFSSANVIAGSANFTFIDDSLILNGVFNALDSIYLNYAIDAEGDTQWVALSSTGALYADSLGTASYGLSMDIPGPVEYLNDQKNNEVSWYLLKDNVLIKRYSFKGSPAETAVMLAAGHEIQARYIAHNRILISILMIWSVLMSCVVIYLLAKKK